MNCLTKWFKKGKKNLGHRLYGDFIYPENSMASLIAGHFKQEKKEFLYWEFDVVEVADGGLFVFHDATKNKSIKRMCPTAHQTYIDQPIYKLTTPQVEMLKLEQANEHIPFVKEVISTLAVTAIKPVNVEIKKMFTQEAQISLIAMVTEANKTAKVEVYFSMFKNKFNKMPNNRWFLRECGEKNINFKFL